MQNDKFEGLRQKLAKLEWPTEYMFKFIAPVEKSNEVISILPVEDFSTKTSENGNYVSFTSLSTLESEEEVIDIYKKAAAIKGVISL